MIWRTLVLVLILAVPAYAQESPYPFSVLFLSFRDIGTDELITEIPVSLQFSNLDLGTKTTITRIVDRDGVSRYELRAGNWELEAVLDNQRTSESDYYTRSTFAIEQQTFVTNLSVYVTPVGGLEGTVIDRVNNRISGAALEFQCKSDQHSIYPAETNQFGAFRVDMVPVGKCKVSAAYQGKVGTEEVKVTRGELVEVTVNLDKSIVAADSNTGYLIASVLALGIGGLGWYAWKLRRKLHHPPPKQEPVVEAPVEQEVVQEEPSQEGELNPRARDIMATLKENEVTILKFLLANANASTQAKIRNATNIPKTTLARSFLALEEKKVLKIDKIGKMKRVELTNWFLGKE